MILLQLAAYSFLALSLSADLLSKSLSALQFQHHENKFFLVGNDEIIRRRFYVRLFDKPVAAGCPDNDLADAFIALNGDLLAIGQDAKGLAF